MLYYYYNYYMPITAGSINNRIENYYYYNIQFQQKKSMVIYLSKHVHFT